MNKPIITALMAVATLSTASCASNSYDDGHRYYGRQYGSCYAGERRDDCRERLRYESRYNRHYVWRDDHYESNDTAGAAVAGGIIGFILGAAIAGSNSDRDYYNAHRNDRDWQNRCRSSYPNFDSRTGTYIGQDGYRHYCTR
jgi:hypothetical protein